MTLRSYYKWLEKEAAHSPDPFIGLRLDLKVPQRLPRPVARPTLTLATSMMKKPTVPTGKKAGKPRPQTG